MIIKTIDFPQTTPSDTWIIEHNFGLKPVVDVLCDVNGSLQKLYPLSVVHTDDNTLTVTFTTPFSGVARLVGIGPIELNEVVPDVVN